jgi:hypothetical protein
MGEKIKRIKPPDDKVDIKWDDTEAKTVFPDIVVHERGNDKNNLLVIEIKKSGNNSVRESFDKGKLKAFTKEPYSYELGLFIKFDGPNKTPVLKWFKNGVEQENRKTHGTSKAFGGIREEK